MADRHVVLIGMMGVGKSTLGRLLAERLGRPHSDSDEVLEARIGRSGRDLAIREGVWRLHELEADVLLDELADRSPKVISAAASVVDDPRCREALAGAFVCWLRLPVQELMSRIERGHHRRSVDEAELAELNRRREPLYASVADLELDASLSPAALAAAVIEALGEGPGSHVRPSS